VNQPHLDNLPVERATMEKLVALMQQEQQSLIHAEVETLAALAAEKQQLVNQMNVFGAARSKALAAAGLTADDAGMNAALAAHDHPSSATDWHALLELTVRAKELNRVNGLLINKHLAHTQGALAALQVQAPDASVYGPNGMQTGGVGPRRGVVG
jgi:flagella synthesis protein FlgN